MAEAPKIAGFGQDDQGEDGADAGNRLQPPEIGMIGQARHNLFFELPPHLAQMQVFVENKPEHADRLRVFRHRHPMLFSAAWYKSVNQRVLSFFCPGRR
jgi:hypothetical protein